MSAAGVTGLTAPVRVGIIGYGYAGEVIHAPLIRAVPELELHAVSTGRPERQELARSRGLVVYPTAESLLADPTVSLIVIATPHDSHLPLTRAACEAGKHVVCDKLMALDVHEAEAMVRAASEAGTMLSVFHNRRWDGDYLAVRAVLGLDHTDGSLEGSERLSGFRDLAGSLGDLIRIRAWVHSEGRPDPSRWRARREKGGGIFSDWGAHLMDQALALREAPAERVRCQMLYAVPEVDVETSALCVIDFADGSSHVIETNQLYHEASKGYEIWGTGGRIVIRGFDPRENLLNVAVRGVERRGPGYETERYGEGVRDSPESGEAVASGAAAPSGRAERATAGAAPLVPPPGDWEAYYRAIAAHLIHGAPQAVTAESVLRMMRLREAAFESAATGRTVTEQI